jgi:hypothetical protein
MGLAMACSMLMAGVLPTATSAEPLSPRELVPLLTRSGVAPDLTIIEVIYAPPLFFESTGLQPPEEMELQPTLAFLLQETVHDGELPLVAPEAFLLLPEGERIAAYDAGITTEDEHHRISRLLFPRPDEWPEALRDEQGDTVLRLIVPRADGTFTVSSVFEWTVPIEVDGIELGAE